MRIEIEILRFPSSAERLSLIEQQLGFRLADTPPAVSFYVAELGSNLTALQLAAYIGHAPTLTALLRKSKTSINQHTTETEDAFQYCVRTLSGGYLQANGEFTALHLAAKSKSYDCIIILLNFRANYGACDKLGNPALSLDELCACLPHCVPMRCLDLSIYGKFKAEYLASLARALSHGSIHEVIIDFPNIDLGYYSILSSAPMASQNPNVRLLLDLLEVLKQSVGLTSIKIKLNYEIYTTEDLPGLIFGWSHFKIDYVRSGISNILSSLLSVVESNHSLTHVDCGDIKHIHETKSTSRSVTYRATGNIETVTTSTSKSLSNMLSLNNSSIAHLGMRIDHTSYFHKLNASLSACIRPIDGAYYIVFDEGVFLAFCARFNAALARNDQETLENRARAQTGCLQRACTWFYKLVTTSQTEAPSPVKAQTTKLRID